MEEYDLLFNTYFENDILLRGMPIRGGNKLTWKEGNCAGDPPNDSNCKGGYFCNITSRKWQCKT